MCVWEILQHIKGTWYGFQKYCVLHKYSGDSCYIGDLIRIHLPGLLNIPAAKSQQPFYARGFELCIKYRWMTFKRIIIRTLVGVGVCADETGAISHGNMQMWWI